MNKRFKTIQAIIAMILVVITVTSPISIMASPTDVTESAEISEQEIAEEDTSSEEEAYILYEDTDMRDESTKYFRMSDGTLQAAQYSVPVHFEQNGEWADYDNFLDEVDADDSENSSKLLKNKDLTNRTADYSVRLSKKTNGKKFVRIEKDGYKISWYYKNADKSTAEVKKNESDNDLTTLENLTSAVTYKNVYKNTDFEYIIGSDGVKENIILKSKKAPAEFTAEYKANGLAPVQADEKTIELQSADGTVIYTLTAPFAEDAQGNTSPDIALTLVENKNDTFTVKTSLDSKWLNAEDREYPVLADPVLKTHQDAKEVQSAFVASEHPDKCYKASGTDDMGSLYVGNIYGYGQTESYMKFTNLPALGVADKVVDARLYLGLRKCEVGLDVNVKRLKEDWNEKTVTWHNGPHSDDNISDYLMLTEKTDLTSFREVEITDIVRGWYADPNSNHGLSLSTTKTAAAKAWFYSINYTTYTSNRPVLTVSYRNMSGYEDYWSFTDIAAGRGGTASVNNYNGNFIFSQPLTQDAGGNLMPVNISLVYNSNKGDAKYGFIGSHIQTNYQMYLVKQGGEYWDNGYKYYLNDADGTIHYFYFENGSNTVGKDEDGLGYTLNVISVGSDKAEEKANYVITDKDENKMYFDSAGRLLRIKNPSDKSIIIKYNTNNQISSVTDGAEREYKYIYSTNNAKYLAHIEDPAGRKTSFDYRNGCLVKIKFADGESFEINYHGDHLIKYIKGIDGTYTWIGYDQSKQRRVDVLKWCASDEKALENYTFEYLQNATTIKDIQGRSYTFQFNDFAQTTGTVSNTDGSAQFFKLNSGNSTSGKANKLISESRVLQTTTNYIKNPGFIRGFESYWTYINNTSGASVTIDGSKKNITDSSVKVTKSASNTGRVNCVQTVTGLPAGTYTLSAYIFTDGREIPGAGVQMFPEVRDAKDKIICNTNIEKTTIANGWERRSVTFDMPANARLTVNMGFGPDAYGTVWFDDIQLEKSENASTFNLIENSAFNNGLTAWSNDGDSTSSVTWAGLTGFDNCAKLTGSVEGKYKRQRQKIYVSGKKGDVFSYGAWAYAFSAPLNGIKNSETYKPHFEVAIDYYDKNDNWLGCINKYFNPDIKDEWQFLADQIVMPEDYGSIAFLFTYDHNVNNAYQTGAFCYKEQYGQTYDYDKDGNVTSVVDIAKTNSTFSYYGNQMAKMLNPSGSKYLYNYNNKKQMTNALSSDGLEYGFAYDGNGNLIKTRITSRKPAIKIENGKEYFIVNAYSGHAIDSCEINTPVKTTPYIRAAANSKSALKLTWTAESSGKTDVFYLKASAFSNAYMDVKSASSTSGAELQLHAGNKSNAQRFQLIEQDDGSFAIYTEASGFKMCVNGQYGDKEIKDRRIVKQSTCDKNKLYESQKWYFYPVEQTYDKTIVTETEYASKGNFVSKSIDERGNTTSYDYDEKKGTLKSVTNANNVATQYTYDSDNNSLLSVSSSGVTNSYDYSKDRLQNINVNGALQYTFDYDKFGRTTANKVGNGTNWKTLSEMDYNTAGLLAKQTYGNGDYVDFTYDSFDRQTQKQYNGDNSQRVTYSYGNNGSVAQITDYFTNSNTRFTYDLAERVVSQREYKGTAKNGGELLSYTDFTYANKTNYLTGIKHFSPLGTQTIGYTYGNLKRGYMPDQVYGVSWNGANKLQNYYDDLGRLVRKSFNGIKEFGSVYTYEDITVNNDQRTTTLVKSVATPTGTLTYTYDKLGNILSVTDGTYTTSYEYDSLNQLTRVNDEKAGKTYTYSYTNGNITGQNEYAYTISDLGEPLNTKTWEYNDSTWSDLLTNYNGTPITYDEIGNPLTIGSKSLTWTGRQLQSITDGDTEIAYTYNGDGLRTSKTVNGTKTEYYYNGSILAGQKTGEDTLVFMYDNNSDIFGFIYNDTEYYYIKNAQNDVVAIADKDGNVLIKYTYDAWGKVISITDKDGNAITETTNEPTNASNDIDESENASNDIDEESVGEGLRALPQNNENSVDIDTTVGNGVLDVLSNTAEPTTADETTTVDKSFSLTSVDPQIAKIANLNPILYRSYYYDKETEWYYLNSRFYNPEFCRFINSDNENLSTQTPAGLTDKNLFAYCDNNPINRVDKGGNFWDTVFDVISLAVSIASVAKDPKDPVAWIGLAVDVACLVIPGVTGGGALVKASTKVDDAADVVKAVNKIDNSLDAVNTTKKGWKVGDDIASLTKAGNKPSWSTVRQRYWKNQTHSNPLKYSNENLSRMKKGLAPIGKDGFSMELHHPYGRKGKNFYKFTPLTRTQHRYIHYGRR